MKWTLGTWLLWVSAVILAVFLGRDYSKADIKPDGETFATELILPDSTNNPPFFILENPPDTGFHLNEDSVIVFLINGEPSDILSKYIQQEMMRGGL